MQFTAVSSEVRGPRGTRARTLAATVIGMLVAAVLAAAAVIDPLIVLGAVAAIAATAICWMTPRAFLLISVLVILLSPQIATLGAGGSFADEAVILVSAVILTARRVFYGESVVILPGTFWFSAFTFVGILSAVTFHVPTAIWAQGAFAILKSLLFAHALAQAHWGDREIARIARIGAVVAATLLVIGLLNLALYPIWGNFVPRTSGSVGGLPTLTGPYSQAAAFGRLTALLAIGVFLYQLLVRISARGMILALGLSFMTLLTFKVRSLVSIIAGAAIAAALTRRVVWLVGFVVGSAVVAALAGQALFAFVFGDVNVYLVQESARSRLIEGGYQVAVTHFPLGAGFGRYGSSVAADTYSPEYVALGFRSVFGLSDLEGWGAYLNDTQWPAIIGEAGWIGLALYLAGVVAVAISMLRATSAGESDLVRWIRICGIAWLAMMLIESIGGPVFTSPPGFIFLFAGAGIVASIRFDARSNPAMTKTTWMSPTERGPRLSPTRKESK